MKYKMVFGKNVTRYYNTLYTLKETTLKIN